MSRGEGGEVYKREEKREPDRGSRAKGSLINYISLHNRQYKDIYKYNQSFIDVGCVFDLYITRVS